MALEGTKFAVSRPKWLRRIARGGSHVCAALHIGSNARKSGQDSLEDEPASLPGKCSQEYPCGSTKHAVTEGAKDNHKQVPDRSRMQGIAAAEETTADERKNANTGPKETSLSPSEHALAHRRHYSHDGCVALDVDDAILPGDAQLERPAGTKPAAPTRMRRSQSCASAKMPQTTSPSRTGGLCFQAYSLSRDCNSYAPVSLGPESPVQCRGERFFIAPVEMKLKVVVSGSELDAMMH